jgi:hypothetical protein
MNGNLSPAFEILSWERKTVVHSMSKACQECVTGSLRPWLIAR